MENQDQFQQYECLMFDLDDTLYPQASGISAQVTENIKEYMIKKLRIEESKVPELCVFLYKNYGTTMAGLKAIGFNFDFDDFHGFVHGRLPYNLLKPDPVLRSLLLSLPFRKILFTNGDKAHAARALNRLGLEGCFQFQDIISFETLNPKHSDLSKVETDSSNGIIDVDKYLNQPDSSLELPRTPVICKPFKEAFEKVFEITMINPRRTMFFDDSVRNLQAAKNWESQP